MTEQIYPSPGYSLPRRSGPDLTSQVFERLTVLYRLGAKDNHMWWNCLCICGKECKAVTGALRSGNITSCGCKLTDTLKLRNTTHNLSGSRAYAVWAGMKDRCRNPNNAKFNNYGGRGIDISESWVDFDNFVADMGQPPKGLTLERVDNELGYSKENCTWVRRVDQTRNRSITLKLTYEGETRSLAEWSEITGIPYTTLKARKQRLGYTDEECLTKLVQCGMMLAGKTAKPKAKSDYVAPAGYKNYCNKFTKEQVREMQTLYDLGGQTFSSVGRAFGCSVTTASNICQRKKYYA